LGSLLKPVELLQPATYKNKSMILKNIDYSLYIIVNKLIIYNF